MGNAGKLIRQHIQDSIAVKDRMAQEQGPVIAEISQCLLAALRDGGTVYLCGNGGSAADAQHVAAEFVGRFLRERRPLPAVALTTNTSILTAIGNDYDFNQVFARQVRAQVTGRDAVVGISTSGKSPNVLQAFEAARAAGARTVGFTGQPGQPLASSCDLCLCVPSNQTPRIQEAHILAWHVICDLIEREFAEAW
jgi:D-sedoheptulose 7-phosphate isomerase